MLLFRKFKYQKIDGARVERVLELVNVAANKNTVPGDKSALVPGGLRIGTPAMTTRGFKEAEFARVVDILHKAVQIALQVQSQTKGTKFADFKETLGESGKGYPEIEALKNEVVEWTREFPVVGFRFDTMRYR